MADIPKPTSEVSQADAQALAKLAIKRSERQKAEKLFTSASDARKRYDWEWLNRDLFRRGYQFSRTSPNNRTIVLQTRSSARIPINITHAQMRTIKNQVTSIRPKWEVSPRGLSEEAIKNARYSGKLLDNYYDFLGLRRLLKDTVIQGLEYSVGGPWQIGYDPYGGEDGTGDAYAWLVDPFDFYIDSNAHSLANAEYVVKAVRTSLNAVRANPDYEWQTDRFEIQGDPRLAASEYKQFLLQALRFNQSTDKESEESGVILKEAWIKIHVNERNLEEIKAELEENNEDTDNLRVGEVVMRFLVYLDSVEDPLQYKLLRDDQFPFSLFQADVNPMEIYGESWIKHVIPMNRALNALESSIFKYNYKYAIGRIVIDKNSGVRIFTNEHGDIIEKNAGAEVSSMPLQPLPASYQQQIQNMRMYIEDVGGAHEVSMGRVPAGVKSGIGIAELKAADAVNQQDLIDGLEDFLVDVGQKLLHVIARNFSVPKVIKVLGKGGDPEHFAIIGEKATNFRNNVTKVKIGMDNFDLAVIGDKNEVKVSVGSWLAYTKGARLEMLKEWFGAGLIDQQTFLENAEFADIAGIVDRTREEDLLKKAQGTEAQGTPGVTDEEIAVQENQMMAEEGRSDIRALPEDRHQIHLAVHQRVLGTRGNPIVEAHMTEHEDYIRQGIQVPARPEAQMQPPQPPTAPAAPGAPAGAVAPVMGQPVAPTGMVPPVPMPPGAQAPPMMMGAPPPGNQAPLSPEEQALMQSLMEITGGR
jgi:hypothetical protein